MTKDKLIAARPPPVRARREAPQKIKILLCASYTSPYRTTSRACYLLVVTNCATVLHTIQERKNDYEEIKFLCFDPSIDGFR